MGSDSDFYLHYLVRLFLLSFADHLFFFLTNSHSFFPFILISFFLPVHSYFSLFFIIITLIIANCNTTKHLFKIKIKYSFVFYDVERIIESNSYFIMLWNVITPFLLLWTLLILIITLIFSLTFILITISHFSFSISFFLSFLSHQIFLFFIFSLSISVSANYERSPKGPENRLEVSSWPSLSLFSLHE